MDEMEPRQALVDLRAGEVHAMIVVPQRRGWLIHRIDVFSIANHARLSVVEVSSFAVGGKDEVGWISVMLRGCLTTVKVHGNRHRQFIVMCHDGTPSATRYERRARHDAVISPYLGCQPCENRGLTDLLGDLVVVRRLIAPDGLEDGWDGESGTKRFGKRCLAVEKSACAALSAVVGFAADAAGSEQRGKPNADHARPTDFQRTSAGELKTMQITHRRPPDRRLTIRL